MRETSRSQKITIGQHQRVSSISTAEVDTDKDTVGDHQEDDPSHGRDLEHDGDDEQSVDAVGDNVDGS